MYTNLLQALCHMFFEQLLMQKTHREMVPTTLSYFYAESDSENNLYL